MTKVEREEEVRDAIKIGRFVLWSRSLKDVQGIALVDMEIRELCEAAGEFIVKSLEESAERRKVNQQRGRKGGAVKSKAKKKSSRKNGKLGGRPIK